MTPIKQAMEAAMEASPVGMKLAEDWSREMPWSIHAILKCDYNRNISEIQVEGTKLVKAIQQDAIQAERAKNREEIERLMLRSVVAMHIAEDERALWEGKVSESCPMIDSVLLLRNSYDSSKAAIQELCEALRTIQIAREHSKVCDCFNCSLISKHSQGDK